jgi:hypothetical protein
MRRVDAFEHVLDLDRKRGLSPMPKRQNSVPTQTRVSAIALRTHGPKECRDRSRYSANHPSCAMLLIATVVIN